MSKTRKEMRETIKSIVRSGSETVDQIKAGIVHEGSRIMGEGLLSQASQEHEKESQQMIVEETKKIIRLRDEREEWARNALRARDHYNDKLKAISEGKFSIAKDRHGYHLNFNDGRLNAADLAI